MSAEKAERFRAQLAGLLLSEETVSGLVDMVVNLAASAIGGVAGASISQLVGDDRRLETTGASSEAARAVDDAQYLDWEGPCVEAIRTGTEVTITVPTDRWPTFSARAQQAGLCSVLSLPLRVRERTTGALNLYSTAHEPISMGRRLRRLVLWPARRPWCWPTRRRFPVPSSPTSSSRKRWPAAT